jgi:hypothetical protein
MHPLSFLQSHPHYLRFSYISGNPFSDRNKHIQVPVDLVGCHAISMTAGGYLRLRTSSQHHNRLLTVKTGVGRLRKVGPGYQLGY